MRVWIDITNSPHVLVLPAADRAARGATATRSRSRRASTRRRCELLELHGLEHEVVGPRHGGAGALGKARALAGRLRALRRFAKGRGFDVALAHGSHELTLAARSLGVPSATAFDYEFARAAAPARLPRGDAGRRPGRDPAGAARPARRDAPKLRRYPGLKEEYYLADFEPDPRVLDGHRPGQACSSSCGRRPTSRSTTGTANPLFADVLERLGRDERVHAVVLPRTDEQRARSRGLGLPSLHRPRARGRRAEPDRARRPRRLGGRDDEPRGRGARRARLHDVRRAARRGRRAAHPRGTTRSARRAATRSRSRSATRPRHARSGAIRGCCSTCSLSACQMCPAGQGRHVSTRGRRGIA